MIPSPPKFIDDVPSPRIIKTHLPHKVLPKQLWEKAAKVIYIARNPKDLAVSYYNFSKYNLVMPDYNSFGHFVKELCAAKGNFSGEPTSTSMFCS